MSKLTFFRTKPEQTDDGWAMQLAVRGSTHGDHGGIFFPGTLCLTGKTQTELIRQLPYAEQELEKLYRAFEAGGGFDRARVAGMPEQGQAGHVDERGLCMGCGMIAAQCICCSGGVKA